MPTLTADERAERRAAEREQMKAAVEALRTSDGWQRWLRTRATFHGYSLIILSAGVARVARQRPCVLTTCRQGVVAVTVRVPVGSLLVGGRGWAWGSLPRWLMVWPSALSQRTLQAGGSSVPVLAS